jgi:hypothetical protein
MTDIICDSCSELAVSVPDANCLDDLEGKPCVCESCGDAGKLYLHEPDGGDAFDARVRFRPYRRGEAREVVNRALDAAIMRGAIR